MKRSKIFMLFAAVLLASLFVFPLWNITLEAPQYPDPLGMDIYINKFHGVNDNDIKNIKFNLDPSKLSQFDVYQNSGDLRTIPLWKFEAHYDFINNKQQFIHYLFIKSCHFFRQ